MTVEVDPFDEIFANDEYTPADSDPEPEVDPEPLADPEPTEPEPPADPEPPAESEPEIDYKAELEKERQRFKSFEGRYRKEKETWESRFNDLDQKIGKTTPAEPPAAEPDPDEEFLSQFREKYNDEVLKAVELVSARKARELVDQVRKEAIDPLVRTTAESAREAHFRTIESAHGDWETVVQSEAFGNWVNQQPRFIAQAYRSVLEQGTAHDVVDLLGTYKESTRPPATTQTKVDPARARAATAVKTQRGMTPKPRVSNDDFDAAWDEAE